MNGKTTEEIYMVINRNREKKKMKEQVEEIKQSNYTASLKPKADSIQFTQDERKGA